jgi:hypothetical protein
MSRERRDPAQASFAHDAHVQAGRMSLQTGEKGEVRSIFIFKMKLSSDIKSPCRAKPVSMPVRFALLAWRAWWRAGF